MLSEIPSPAARSKRVLRLPRMRVDAGTLLWGCILLGLLLRLLYNYSVPPETWGDTPRYDEIAGYWSSGWSPWEAVAPVDLRGGLTYPLLLSGLYSLFGHAVRPVIALQHFLGLLLIPLSYNLARQAFSPAVGLLAALLVALDPALIRYEHRVMTEIPFTFLFVLFLLGLTHQMRTGRLWPLALGGVSLGLAILTRPNMQFFPIVVPLLLLGGELARRGRSPVGPLLRSTVLSSLVFLVATATVVAPWVVRNHVNYGYTGISAIAGQLHKKTRPYGLPQGNHPEIRRMKGSLRLKLASDGYTWLEYDRILSEMASEDVRTQPVVHLRLSWETFNTMWGRNDFLGWQGAIRGRPEYKVNAPLWRMYPGSPPDLAKRFYDGRIWPWIPPLALLGALAYVLLPFFAWALNVLRGREPGLALPVRAALLLPVMYVAVTGALASDTGNPRYRLVMDPLIFAFVGAALVGALQLVRRTALWTHTSRSEVPIPPAA